MSQRSEPTERTIPELETTLAQSRETQAFYLLTIAALRYCIKKFSLELPEIQAEHFKDELETRCGHVLGEGRSATLQRIFADYKDSILAYIAREKAYYSDHHAKFKNIIEVLTSALTTLGQSNQECKARIYEHSL